jgi:hypothetical protein
VLALLLSLWNILVERIPLLDAPTVLKVQVVDVVGAFIPSFETAGFQGDDLFAETTPERALSVPSDPPLSTLLTDVLFVVGTMVLSEVGEKGIAAVEQLGTLVDLARRLRFVTAPCLQLVVLGVFMSFPVVFTSKPFGAVAVRAAPRSGMSFLVLPAALSAGAHRGRGKHATSNRMADPWFWDSYGKSLALLSVGRRHWAGRRRAGACEDWRG